MTETAWSALRQMFVHRYGELCAQLARRLNSEELAREALHDTWLHLRQKQGSEGIHNPAGYLLRTAFNIAIDERRRAARSARWIEVDAFLDAADDLARAGADRRSATGYGAVAPGAGGAYAATTADLAGLARRGNAAEANRRRSGPVATHGRHGAEARAETLRYASSQSWKMIIRYANSDND
ncbi:hypothetical protein [Methylosinus trichosporium]|uniref:hypothetical protein n=1 Tax=Methylosinus trichosporium TaxID=426 RepID=UPI003D26F9C2